MANRRNNVIFGVGRRQPSSDPKREEARLARRRHYDAENLRLLGYTTTQYAQMHPRLPKRTRSAITAGMMSTKYRPSAMPHFSCLQNPPPEETP